MDGGTFTISNGGVFGSLMGTPIINPPQSAILGMHGIFDRPVAVKGEVTVGFIRCCWQIAVHKHNSLHQRGNVFSLLIGLSVC